MGTEGAFNQNSLMQLFNGDRRIMQRVSCGDTEMTRILMKIPQLSSQNPFPIKTHHYPDLSTPSEWKPN